MSENEKCMFKEAFNRLIEDNDIIRTWLKMMITNEIEQVKGTIRNQELATLGGDPYGEENLKRLYRYREILEELNDSLSII